MGPDREREAPTILSLSDEDLMARVAEEDERAFSELVRRYQGRVTNLELRDESGSCRFALWDEDVGLVERGKVAVGTTVRALDCYVKRTNFGLDVSRGKFGALLVEAA